MRYDYHTGLRSQEAALDAIEAAYATGDISRCEQPRAEPYKVTERGTGRSLRRWKITLTDTGTD